MPIDDFDYVELHSSGHGYVGEGRDSVFTREYLIAWEDLGGFLRALRGGWEEVAPDTFQYVQPTQCDEDGFSDHYCVAADFDSYGTSWTDVGGHSVWAQCIVTAQFRVPVLNPADPANLSEEELDFSVEELLIPPGTMKTATDGEIIGEPLRVLMPLCAYTVTIHDQQTLPGGNALTILSLLGLVNAETFRGAAAEKMLFMGARTSRSVTTSGTRGWRIEYRFLYRPIQWNEVFINISGTLTKVRPVDGEGKFLYGTTDQLPVLMPGEGYTIGQLT